MVKMYCMFDYCYKRKWEIDRVNKYVIIKDIYFFIFNLVGFWICDGLFENRGYLR